MVTLGMLAIVGGRRGRRPPRLASWHPAGSHYDDGDVDPEVARLAGLLDELATLLAAHAQERWAEWLARDATLLRAGDGYGVLHFRSAFGGMGSLEDVILSPGPTESAADDWFRSLRTEAWNLSTALVPDTERHERG
jgi:hypothetical protein